MIILSIKFICLAQLCDKIEHRLRKERTNDPWIIDVARSADIIISKNLNLV